MKRIVLFFFSIALISTEISAQSSRVTTAYNEMRDGDFVSARKEIDQAITHEKTKDDDKTWRYRGMIYAGLAESDSAEISQREALEEAMESFKKAMELDTKEKWLQENRTGFAKAQNKAMNLGIEAYNAKNYEKAKELFLLGVEGAEELNVVDTMGIYNAGLAAEQSGDLETAVAQYKKAAEYGYLGPKMYLYTANIYQRQDKQDEYLKVVREGRAKYPEDADLIVYELNYYLQNERFEEAKENLQLAINKEPDNKQLHFSLGVVHDNLGEYDQAIESYKKALEIDPNYFDALFNLGALYFNRGVEMNNAANAIEDNTKYEAAKEEAKEEFRKALPYLEKAHELQPDDQGAISSLKQLYALLGMNDKYNEMKQLEIGAEEE